MVSRASGGAAYLMVVLSLGVAATRAQSPPEPANEKFELPSFVGAHSLRELEQAKSAREGDSSPRKERRLVDDSETKRRAEEERRAAAEEEVKRKAEEVRRLAQREAEARRKLHDEQRLIEQENEAKRRADERFRMLAVTPPAATDNVQPTPVPQPAIPPAVPAPLPQRAAIAVPTLPRNGTPCPTPEIETVPLSGGRMRVDITSPCRAGQLATLRYGPYGLGQALDGAGKATMVLDMFLGRDEKATAEFQDGSRRPLTVVGKDLTKVSKVAVAWRAAINLDLHAFEYTAKAGDAGHVWSGATPSVDAIADKVSKSGRGQGVMSSTADAATVGDRIEVYTFWHGDGEHRGVVTMALDYETRGDKPAGETCGDGKLASLEVTVWRLGRGASAATSEQRLLSAVPCGVILAREVRFNPDSMPHLTVK